MTALGSWWLGARVVLSRLATAALLLMPVAASAAERAQILATSEDGFGRFVIKFPDRLDLPRYKVRNENGVLAIEFEDELDVSVPDIAVTLPDFVSIARLDPDGKGIRVGLRTSLSVHHIEAGEQLFIDLLPITWQGLPPSLPPAVVAALADRAKQVALQTARERRAREARELKPAATVRVGRNPTFMRIQFDWTHPTKGEFHMDGKGQLVFDWPVPVDLYSLKADLPAEITAVENALVPDGTQVTFSLAEGVAPRFYQISDRQFIVDVDIAGVALNPEQTLEELKKLVPAAAVSHPDPAHPSDEAGAESGAAQTELTPVISSVGSTVRFTFGFERDTAAAVFRRGSVVWMIFDTPVIVHPLPDEAVAEVASAMTTVTNGDTQVVRLDLGVDRLATLASEGRAWVLSIGDVLLSPTEPMPLARRRSGTGELEMTADLATASRVHEFRDPIVGDVLKVATAFPPARGVSRPLSYVDFTALASVQGLVVRPTHDEVAVELEGNTAIISSEGGLTLSPEEHPRVSNAAVAPAERSTFIDLVRPRVTRLEEFGAERERLITEAASTEGAPRDAARLDLARFFIANQFHQEALGVLEIMLEDLHDEELRRPARIALAIASTLANRQKEALDILGSGGIADEVDATMWRAIARAGLNDFSNARLDAMAAEPVLDSYPRWVRDAFLFAGIRAAVETNDFVLAQRYLGLLELAKLDPEQVSWYQLFTARIAEVSNRIDEALDGYGQVIAADIRPSRAEAVFRTLLLLDKADRIDVVKATEALSAEVLLWRGDRLEPMMQKFLAELYFRGSEYRPAFETVRDAVHHFPEDPSSAQLLAQAQTIFSELYLDGVADQLEPVDALSLYYDFRELTPPGARGDEMIRNLVRRLVKVDLLTQAAELLQYQIDNRLEGAAQAQVAAELALIELAARNPQAALRVLNRTRLADLPPSLERQRRILEARALIDADREDLALDLLRSLTGRDADMLRIEGMWQSKQYQGAAELMEVMFAPGNSGEPMTAAARMSILRAAVGFVLAGDQMGLSRLRSKAGEDMAQSPEWPLFDFVTGQPSPQSAEFRAVVREVSGIDSLNAFLSSYRELYAGPDDPAPLNAAPEGTQG